MNEGDKERFHEMINLAFELAHKPVPEDYLVRAYYIALERFDIDEISEALNRHAVDVDVGMWAPRPADIVRNISGNTQTQAEIAWTKVDKAIRSVGSHESVCFDDPLIHAVITDMSGWITLCHTDDDEYPFKHNEFVRRYRGYISRPPVRVLKRLIGSNEHGCSNFPEHIAPPILVGDKDKALLLFGSGTDQIEPMMHQMTNLVGDAVKQITGGDNEDR